MFGAPLEVQMSKKCTPLQRKTLFQVKTYAGEGTWSGSMPCKALLRLQAVGWMVRYMEYP